jgi:hypothetical protein
MSIRLFRTLMIEFKLYNSTNNKLQPSQAAPAPAVALNAALAQPQGATVDGNHNEQQV